MDHPARQFFCTMQPFLAHSIIARLIGIFGKYQYSDSPFVSPCKESTSYAEMDNGRIRDREAAGWITNCTPKRNVNFFLSRTTVIFLPWVLSALSFLMRPNLPIQFSVINSIWDWNNKGWRFKLKHKLNLHPLLFQPRYFSLHIFYISILEPSRELHIFVYYY